MTEARFWSVVGSLGPDLTTGRLIMALNALTPTDLRAFCLWLDQIGAALDTPAHHDQAGSAFELARTDVTHSWVAPKKQRRADFTELQATVVACGPDTWRAVAAGPTLMSGGWPTGLGRAFLLALTHARQRSLRDPVPS